MCLLIETGGFKGRMSNFKLLHVMTTKTTQKAQFSLGSVLQKPTANFHEVVICSIMLLLLCLCC